MSLSFLDQFQSPNEEKKVQLQNRPCIGEESSDECSEEEKRKLPQSNRRQAANHKNELNSKNDKTDLRQDKINQSNYASFSSNQILRNSKEMNNLANNYPNANYKQSSNKQNDRIKYRKQHYNDHDEYNDYNQLNRLDQTDDLVKINDYKTELNQNDSKNQDQNDLSNRKPASALIKKGKKYDIEDYFNKNTTNEYDDDFYSNRKIERRKGRKNSLTNYQQDILPPDLELNNKDYKDLKDPRLLIEKKNNQNRTRFVNKERNYHHYIYKDTNSKRASISSAEISKYDTSSPSSSASPTQDRKTTDLNEIVCIKNNYVGYNIDDVINIDNLNRKKNALQNASILDKDLVKIQKSHSSQKLSALNDLLSIETDELNKNLQNDTFQSNDFSSSFMHKSTRPTRKNSTDKPSHSNDFNLVDLMCKNDLTYLDKLRDPSPELLKFNDEDYEEKLLVVNKKSDLLTDDHCESSFKESNDQTTKINLISNSSMVLQPKIISTVSNTAIDSVNNLLNDSNNLNELDELNELEELNDQEERNTNELKENSKEDNNELINQPNNNLINEIDEDKDDGIESDVDQNDQAIAQLPMNRIINVDQGNSSRKSSNGSNNLKEQSKDTKEATIIYSGDFKINSLINSQLDSSMSSESSFNSTVMSNKIQQNSIKPIPTESNSNSPVTSLDGQLSPKRKTPGYTQRVLNSTNEQVKYGLFQLGKNNVSNSLIDMEQNELSSELKNEELNDNEKAENEDENKSSPKIQKDISRDELVKSILNIPFSKYDCLDQMEDEQSSLNSSLNSSQNVSRLKSNYLNRNNSQQEKIASDLENLNLSDNNLKQHSSVNVTSRNASLGDIRLNNNSSGGNSCKQIKESNSVNSQLNNLNKSNFKSRQNNLDFNNCLDLVLDKSLANNLNFVSNSMSNSSLLNKSNKLANGRLSDYTMSEDKVDSQREKILMDNNFSISNDKQDESEKKDKKESVEKDGQLDKMDKEELLVDTSSNELITSSTTNQYNQQQTSQKFTNKKSPFGQHNIQSKILQETVSNHLLSDSLVDVTGDSFNLNQFESSNKKLSQNKNYNDLCYLDNAHNNLLEKMNESYSGRNHISSRYNNQHNKASEESIRNFSLSPETTDCDSIEVESQFSISSFVSVPGLNQMPVLEDGLSSGSASDTETAQTARLDDLLRKQQNNQHQQNKTNQQKNENSEMEIFAKCCPRVKKNQQLNEYDMNSSENYNCDNSNQSNLNDRDNRQHLKKSRSLNLNNNMQLNNGLDSSESENKNDNLNSEQLWNPKLQQQQQQSHQQQNGGHYNQSSGYENQSDNEVVSNSLLKLDDEKPKLIEKTFHEDDCDTDQETDRLLGAQRTEDRQFYEEKNPPIKKKSNSKDGNAKRPPLSRSVLIEGVLFRARYLGSTQLICEGTPTKATRMTQAEEAVTRIKAPEGENQPSTEVELFISTEKIMVLNADLKEIMMDHSLRTISYIADIGDLLVLMARRRQLITTEVKKTMPKMICHVFESEQAQFIAQSIGQAFQVAYLEFLKANGIEDHNFMKEMDYQEVLNSQEIFGNELEMFSRKERQKEIIIPKKKGEILGMVIVESGWGSMLPTVVVANMAQSLPASRCNAINIGDQIISIDGVSLVGLPLSTCQNYIKNAKNHTVVKLTVVPCAPVVEVKIKRPDTKYQLGFSVQNGVICSLLRGGIAERGGVRVGHRIIEINNQSVVAVPHEKIVNLLATSIGEIHMKTMPTSMFRLLTGQEIPVFM